ncbi:glycoside hydrolase family 72 protein [Gelatoporia subvermispora B]|uniref:1,3-beta-glucanosyltransferase n=1 Tax=Ceriporiopsis subvermispora (strain B) TaxID=914234 RepID=M2QWX6_CERS8|nr:glycoside hydrolase family 72 protein [Gelatoporia subvermispora B]
MHSWRTPAALAALLALASTGSAVQNVSRSGRYLYNADGSRFFIKGVAYQPQGEVIVDPNNPFGEPSTFIDPLANGTACARDLPFLQQLQINAIRAYSVNASLDHDDCMNALSNAGIYTIIDLSLPVNGSINRDQPAWTTNLLDLYIDTINVFNKYNNVLAFNVGNEVINGTDNTVAAAFVKAAARDTRAYLNSIGSSALVGYAAIDGDWIVDLAEYLSCDPSGSNSGSTSIDLWGLNNYEWCGNADPSVYNATNQRFQNYNIPAYFSEFGCAIGGPRPWTEVGTLFTSPMSDIWSGGLGFSYFPASSAAGQFGMVNISADGSTVTTGQDFDNLKTQYTEVSPPNSPSQSSAGSTSFPSCPAENTNLLASTTLPPTPNDAACACLESALSCQFTPDTSNTTSIIGVLINEACSLLGAQGGSCDDISGNGTSGVYGRVSACDPSVELSYVMSEYYEATNRLATSCSFGGNGTVNANTPSGLSASAAASSCLANPSATFTPSAPSGSGAAAPGSSGSSGSSGSKDNGAAGFALNPQAWLGLAVSCAFSLLGGALVLA